MNTVEKYRKAAIKLFNITEAEATKAIVSPEDDNGEWAPDSMAVLYLEYAGLARLSYWSSSGFDAAIELSKAAGVGFVEYINAAVAAVYE